MNEKLINMVLDLKKVENAGSIDDLVDYDFENKSYNIRVINVIEILKRIDDHYLNVDEWLEFQNNMILRLERDILSYLKEVI